MISHFIGSITSSTNGTKVIYVRIGTDREHSYGGQVVVKSVQKTAYMIIAADWHCASAEAVYEIEETRDTPHELGLQAGMLVTIETSDAGPGIFHTVSWTS